MIPDKTDKTQVEFDPAIRNLASIKAGFDRDDHLTLKTGIDPSDKQETSVLTKIKVRGGVHY